MGLRRSDPLAWLVANEQIRQLASRYAVAIGRRDFDAVAGLFVTDVQVGPDAGRDALARDLAARMATIGMAILHVTNHVIEVESATEATGVVGTRAEIEIDGELVVQMIEYGDTYRKVDSEWLFVRRSHRLWYGAAVGANPLLLEPANWPASPTGMGDLADPAPRPDPGPADR